MTVVTRFAPSPTGYLHIGGARTALFSWAYAKKNQGQFILRIEDTDLERSTPEAVQAIMDGMHWLHLDYDEGPIFQTKRMDVYKKYIEQLLKEDKAYLCYSSKEELEVLRESQMKAGLKPKYDGKWRPEPGKDLPIVPTGVDLSRSVSSMRTAPEFGPPGPTVRCSASSSSKSLPASHSRWSEMALNPGISSMSPTWQRLSGWQPRRRLPGKSGTWVPAILRR